MGIRLDQKIQNMQEFYQREKALVTSPFITQDLVLNKELWSFVSTTLDFDFTDKVILDLGCGTGMLSTYFDTVKFYTGMDLNRHENFQRIGDDSHRFVQGNAQILPYQSHRFDYVICLDSFEHYPDQQAAAHEIYRVLKPGGSFFLSIPTYSNVAGLVKKWCERYGNYEKDTWAPFDFWKPEEMEHFMTPHRVRELFDNAGFNQFQMVGYDKEIAIGLCPWIWHPKMPGKIASGLSRGVGLVSKPLVAIWPQLSLHTFWKITI